MIIDRILQIVECKESSKRQFYIKTNLSNGFLDKVKDVGVSKIENILNTYPDINPIWLLTGRGEMLIRKNDTSESQKIINRDNNHTQVSNNSKNTINSNNNSINSNNSNNTEIEYLKGKINDLNKVIKSQEKLIAMFEKNQK